MAERRIPTREEVLAYLHERRNWGRWGKDDQVGAINLITPEKRSKPHTGALGRSSPSAAFSQRAPHGQSASGAALDENRAARRRGAFRPISMASITMALPPRTSMPYAIPGTTRACGTAATRTRRSPLRAPPLAAWSTGVTGLLRAACCSMCPKHRGEPYVTLEKPVHGWELEDIAKAEGITLEPGDAVVVYSGREALQAAHPGQYYYSLRSIFSGHRTAGFTRLVSAVLRD